MKKIDAFTNRYPLSKTLRFSLIPVGKTEENFNAKLLLEKDKKRADAYEKVKGYIDRYHKCFVENVLKSLYLDGVCEYAQLYYQTGKNERDHMHMEKLETQLRKQIAKAFSEHKDFKEIFGQGMVKKILPEFLHDKEELSDVEMFYDFTTYFKGFHDNRKNMYTDEAQTTAISYRCIHENLPKFLDNARSFQKIYDVLPQETLRMLDEESERLFGVGAAQVFDVDYFCYVLAQSGIDKYNNLVGGYTDAHGKKIQGVNEYINLYNQQIAGKDKSKRLPFVKFLYKQILSDKEAISFIPEKFQTDDEVLSAINAFYEEHVAYFLEETERLFADFSEYDFMGIYVTAGTAVSEISNAAFGAWNVISDNWEAEYVVANPMKKNASAEVYYEKMHGEFKKNKSFSIAELQRLGSLSANGSIVEYYKKTVTEKISVIRQTHESAIQLLTNDYTKQYEKRLSKNDDAIERIKSLLDAVKDLERVLKPLLGTGKEENKDNIFYGIFAALFETISGVDRLYDKVRNYITQKPYSKDKIKLNFENPQLFGGWDKNKERDYRTVLLRKDGLYYLAIMDKSNNKIFVDYPEGGQADSYEKIEYKLLPGPNKMLPKVFFAASNAATYAPDKKILEIRRKETFKKGADFDLRDCHTFIDFFKKSIEKHEDWSQFGFCFSPTESYRDISEFYNEVKNQGYSIKYRSISESYINEMVESGQLYLFRIYNKDFSSYSHGTPNMHTLYFRMLFDERNLADVVYKLNGEAEMFYREASIKEKERVIHPANQPIANKNADNPKKESNFSYDIIKDKRFTKRQFSLHIPITMNFKAEDRGFINSDVRMALKYAKENYVIGIDRGERNLLYVCVINEKGEIVEQKSLNEIIGDTGYKVDYHRLLDEKETTRDKARKSWTTIEGIKELKEGYLSQVVHEICRLVEKYDAIVVMEDLNAGFKNSRFKVEKQVYQKFEKMLSIKLNYLVDKKRNPEETGGVLRAYQLTNKEDGNNRGRQNGFVFYVPAWLTSKIDPVTGFVDLLKPKYKSVPDSQAFISKIDAIRYNDQENYFEFDIDYTKFPRCDASYQKKWTLCSYGERIINIRNKEKNNMWDNITICLTDEFKKLLAEYNITDYSKLKEDIQEITSKDFHYRFMHLFANVLQMRNSEIGNVDVDYLISPVKNKTGTFYDSRVDGKDKKLPENADANGAYHIAKKGLWAISVLQETADEELKNANLSIKNAEWLEYVQK